MFRIQPNGATMSSQPIKQVANADSRFIMKTRIKAHEFQINDPFMRQRIDVSEAKKTLKDYQRNYATSAPESLGAEEQNSLWKRAKELKDKFVQGMLSRDEMHPVKSLLVDGTIKVVADYDKMNMNRCVERDLAWGRKNQTEIAEYKNIMRQLCPKDENASLEEQISKEKSFTDVEKFRPHKS